MINSKVGKIPFSSASPSSSFVHSATELGGNYNTYIKQYEVIKGFEINFANPNYDKEAWDKTIEIALESWLENIVYNK